VPYVFHTSPESGNCAWNIQFLPRGAAEALQQNSFSRGQISKSALDTPKLCKEVVHVYLSWVNNLADRGSPWRLYSKKVLESVDCDSRTTKVVGPRNPIRFSLVNNPAETPLASDRLWPWDKIDMETTLLIDSLSKDVVWCDADIHVDSTDYV